MPSKSPRIAARGIVVSQGRLLLVNAWPAGKSDLMCAPGGGVEPGTSIPENLAREVYEETGLRVDVGAPCLVNEFHDPKSGFHQVEVFFRCTVIGSQHIDPDWQDPEHIVSHHVWVTREEMKKLKFKPDCLPDVAFEGAGGITYDPLEEIVM